MGYEKPEVTDFGSIAEHTYGGLGDDFVCFSPPCEPCGVKKTD